MLLKFDLLNSLVFCKLVPVGAQKNYQTIQDSNTIYSVVIEKYPSRDDIYKFVKIQAFQRQNSEMSVMLY